MKKLHGCLKKSCDHEWVLRWEFDLFGRPLVYWFCKKCGEIKTCRYTPYSEEIDQTGQGKISFYRFPCNEEGKK